MFYMNTWVNSYEGPTRSQLVKDTPFYTREDYYSNFEGDPIIAARIGQEAQGILNFARGINWNVMKTLGFGTCDCFIIISGDTY